MLFKRQHCWWKRNCEEHRITKRKRNCLLVVVGWEKTFSKIIIVMIMRSIEKVLQQLLMCNIWYTSSSWTRSHKWLYSQNIAPCKNDSENDSLFTIYCNLTQFIVSFITTGIHIQRLCSFPKLIYRIMHLLLFCQDQYNELFLKLISKNNKVICNS